jgi:hypothetical protein
MTKWQFVALVILIFVLFGAKAVFEIRLFRLGRKLKHRKNS